MAHLAAGNWFPGAVLQHHECCMDVGVHQKQQFFWVKQLLHLQQLSFTWKQAGMRQQELVHTQ
jgi:hypothetical protein